jgi:hypothetical protein
MRICEHDNCANKHDSHGYCANHARQYRKYGHVLTAEEKSATCRKNRLKSSGNLGKVRSVESRLKQSENTKGLTLNTGKTHFKKGISSWNKGLIGVMPPAWNKGKKLSPEHIEKLRQCNLGRTPWNKIGDGVTPQNKLDRTSFCKTMQPLVFKRDNYTCQMCGQYNGNLQVDHIKSWSKHPELRFELENCRTLCMACHYYLTFKRKMPEGIVWGHNLNRRITS